MDEPIGGSVSVLDVARVLCRNAFDLIDRIPGTSLDDYAALVHDASSGPGGAVIADDTRTVLTDCLSEAFSRRWGVRAGDQVASSFANNPVIQTGPHHRLIFDDDFSSTAAFSLRGRALVGDSVNLTFNCSTITLEERSHRGPAWLRFDGTPHRVFDIARRRLSKKSVSEYCEPVGLSPEVKAWMQVQLPGSPVSPELLERNTSVANHLEGVNEHLYERLRKGHGIATAAVSEDFFGSYAAELLSRPSFFRELVEDGRLARMAEDLRLAVEGPLGPFVPTGTDLFWASVDGRVRQLSLRDGVLCSDRFPIQIPFESESLAQSLRNRTLIPGLFVIFLIGSLLPCVRFLGGSYQAAYHEVFRKVLLKQLRHDIPLEQALAANIDARPLVGWGHNVLQANAWHTVEATETDALRFDFSRWQQPLQQLSDDYASFTQDSRWLALTHTFGGSSWPADLTALERAGALR